MFFIIEMLDNIPSKKNNPIFFQKLTEFMKKKHCLVVSTWIAQFKKGGGGGVTDMGLK